jgi:hypothetical protein
VHLTDLVSLSIYTCGLCQPLPIPLALCAWTPQPVTSEVWESRLTPQYALLSRYVGEEVLVLRPDIFIQGNSRLAPLAWFILKLWKEKVEVARGSQSAF